MDAVSIDSNVLASWFERDAADAWWTVDGEEILAAELDLPVTGSDLAEAVRRHGGDVLIFFTGHGSPNGSRVETFASRDMDGGRIFQLAWRSRPDHPWIVAEDLQAASAASAGAV